MKTIIVSRITKVRKNIITTTHTIYLCNTTHMHMHTVSDVPGKGSGCLPT